MFTGRGVVSFSRTGAEVAEWMSKLGPSALCTTACNESLDEAPACPSEGNLSICASLFSILESAPAPSSRTEPIARDQVAPLPSALPKGKSGKQKAATGNVTLGLAQGAVPALFLSSCETAKKAGREFLSAI
jgi:hypothetical protein